MDDHADGQISAFPDTRDPADSVRKPRSIDAPGFKEATMPEDIASFAESGPYPLSPGARRFLAQAPHGHLIEGELVPSLSGETLPIYDPATGRPFAHVAAGGAEDVDRA